MFATCLTHALRQNLAQLKAVAPRLHTKEQVRAVFVVVVLLVTMCGGPVKVSVGGVALWVSTSGTTISGKPQVGKSSWENQLGKSSWENQVGKSSGNQ
jgi:hypothetical protein